MNDSVYLVLQNGRVFKGESFGATGEVTAELVFTTSVVGYVETLTDPSYHGQIVLQTFPLMGNYGIIREDFESEKPFLSGYVVNDLCDAPSNFRCGGTLGDFLAENGVVGIKGVDTREITKIIRDYGVMNAAILQKLPKDIDAFCAELSKKTLSSDVYSVSTKMPYTVGENGKKTVVMWDFGHKDAMVNELVENGCRVVVMPAASTAEEILACKPSGVLLSNGPGDPAACKKIINEIKTVAKSGVPIFGICLGHQLLALAMGGKTVKQKYGHRGGSIPVKETATGKLFITSQNHGYAVSRLPKGAHASFVNLNDGTNEGIEYEDIKAVSVQFHPEAHGGPLDTEFLFGKLMKMMEGKKDAAI